MWWAGCGLGAATTRGSWGVVVGREQGPSVSIECKVGGRVQGNVKEVVGSSVVGEVVGRRHLQLFPTHTNYAVCER